MEGRTDDLLRLPGRDGRRRPVHPVVFHRALELVDAAGWQVRQDQDGLTVLGTASPQAYAFAMFILSTDGQRLLAKHGFAAPALPQ